jgi:hypothetical protein
LLFQRSHLLGCLDACADRRCVRAVGHAERR